MSRAMCARAERIYREVQVSMFASAAKGIMKDLAARQFGL